LLRDAGVEVLTSDELTSEELAWLENEFLTNIFPVLTPIALDPAHPFPFIPNLGFVLCMALKRKDATTLTTLLPLPSKISRFIRRPGGLAGDDKRAAVRFISRERLIIRFINHLCPTLTLESHGAFRIGRDSDVEVEEEAEDRVRVFETRLKRRRRGD